MDRTLRLPEIAVEQYELSNGLSVILHEDHTTPIVAINVWYHVGSRNEKPGKTGFAHFFEHMMFQGSKHWNEEYFKPIQEAGGSANGSTSQDRTNYWEVLPANFLARGLWLEADRMGFLLDAMTEEKLATQRDVVKNERRQSFENEPYGQVGLILSEQMYPHDHPYSWPVIGSHEDLTAASMEDVKDFFRRYYTPSNASLAIGGDFDPAQAKRLVELYFGGLAPGEPLGSIQSWESKLDCARRYRLEDRVGLPQLLLVWHSPRFFAAGDAELDLLASILGSGKSSRLYRGLVYEKRVAQEVHVSQSSSQLSSLFLIEVTARPGVTLPEIERELDAALEELLADGVSAAELGRAQGSYEASYVNRLQNLGGFGGLTDQLNLYRHYTGNANYFQQDLDRYTCVAPADILAAARLWLVPERLAIETHPRPEYRTAEAPASEDRDHHELPRGAPTPRLVLPAIQRRRLANGLEVIVVESHKLPLVSMKLVLAGGVAADPAGEPGLAGLAAEMLNWGTTSRGPLEISEELKSIGAAVRSGAGADSLSVTLETLTRHLDRALEIFADILLHPAFAVGEVERQSAIRRTRLLQERDEAASVAARAMQRILYDGHPYGHSDLGTESYLEGASAAGLRRFYANWYRPQNATLIVVGDVDADAITDRLAATLAGWTPAPGSAAVEFPAAPQHDKRTVYLIDKPGAPQSQILFAQVGERRSSSNYFPLQILNAAFGGMFTSRLNMNLREEKGYTYGVRSGFSFRLAPGPFSASAAVHTRFTGESLAEFARELDDIHGNRPLTSAELDFAKNAIVRGFPRGFETGSQVAAQLADLAVYGLPDSTFADYVRNVEAVTAEDVERAARETLVPRQMAIVVVGDTATIRDGIAALDLGPIEDRQPE